MAPRNGSTPRRRSSYPPRGTTGGRHSPQPNGEGPRRPIEGRQSRSRPTSRTVANGQGPGRPLWVFLVRGRFAAKTPFRGYWISLDFLGFSRPKRDLSTGYERFSLKFFSWRFFSDGSLCRGASPEFGSAKVPS